MRGRLLNHRCSIFRVDDGAFVRHVTDSGLFSPRDVEQVQGGWGVACEQWCGVKFIGDEDHADHADHPDLPNQYGMNRTRLSHNPVTIAHVHGLGLVVRGLSKTSLDVMSTLDRMTMWVAIRQMSVLRVAWIGAVVRGAFLFAMRR